MSPLLFILEGGLIALALWILPLILWIWALVDIIGSNFTGNNKVLWVLIVLFFPFVGALIYLFVGRGQKVN